MIVDHHSCDLSAVSARLTGGDRILEVADGDSAAQAIALSTDQQRVWFVHGTHDVSPERWNDQILQAFARRQFMLRRTGFAPYSALDRWLMRQMGWSTQPEFAVELVEMRRIERAEP